MNNMTSPKHSLSPLSNKYKSRLRASTFEFNQNESDRFIPRRFNGFTNNDSWNMMDKFNHSPLSIMKNEIKESFSKQTNCNKQRFSVYRFYFESKLLN